MRIHIFALLSESYSQKQSLEENTQNYIQIIPDQVIEGDKVIKGEVVETKIMNKTKVEV